MIPDSVLNDIQDRLNIVDIVSQFVPLKKAGRSFKGLCLFHEERTPSFSVNPEKQIFHCFGCGVSGNVFSFIMKYKKVEFREAVEELAARAGVTLPDDDRNTARNSQTAELAHAVKVAADYYVKNLEKCDESSQIHKYLTKRGLTQQALSKFGIGYSPDAWAQFYQYATKLCRVSVLEKAGLILSKSTGGFYDRFRNRMMFPVIDVRGNYVGFGARALDESLPKYLNSPETAIYQKSRHLYGIHLAHQAVRDEDRLIVVEGYMDVIACVQAGISNVVSSCGTALTVEQIRLIKKFTRNVTVMFDADNAGQMASLRGLELLLQEDCEVQVAEVPEGHDPDSYLRAVGADRFRKSVLEKAKTLFEYKYALLMKKYSSQHIEGRVKIAMEMLDTIRKIPNAVFKTELVRKLSYEMKMSETALLTEMEKKGTGVRTLFKHDDRLSRQRIKNQPEGYVPMIERILIGLFLTFPSCTERAKQVMRVDDFKNKKARSIVELIFDEESSSDVKPAQLLNRIQNNDDATQLVAQAVHEVENIGDYEKAFKDCMFRFEQVRQKQYSDDLRQQIRTAEVQGDQQRVRELVEEFNHHSKVIKNKVDLGLDNIT